LILTESQKNYCQLFKDFLSFHDNKVPKLVITDGAPALTSSSDKVFSCCRLRCNWHLWRNLLQRYGKNFKENQGLKANTNKWFRTYDKSKFEALYLQIKADLKDGDLHFLEKLHLTKKDWSKAYNSTIFNANTLATTRNESWHSKIKHSLSSFTELSSLVDILLEIDGKTSYRSEKAQKVTYC